jgi:hypothetical protein
MSLSRSRTAALAFSEERKQALLHDEVDERIRAASGDRPIIFWRAPRAALPTLLNAVLIAKVSAR